jgi:phage baseplate assembly protein gpV
MDRRARYFDQLSWIKELIDQALAHTWVAAPGIVQSFNASDCTAAVQVAIMWQAKDKTGTWKNQCPAPIIPKALVLFPGNSDFQFTFPLKAGDEGLLVFCDRCIDAWWQQGGVQGQYDTRKHDATDGVFIPGLKSISNVPSSINSNSAELRSKSGNTKLAFDDTNGLIITTGNQVKINGNLQVTGSITAGQGGADSVGLQTHTHPSNGAPPTAGT